MRSCVLCDSGVPLCPPPPCVRTLAGVVAAAVSDAAVDTRGLLLPAALLVPL
jgi:hypothetical protein